ncbi:MAG: D-glycerate dehydrogenase [Chloroflexi bacterium]|nr:MAG: D-glycerate dehydrogenase [Chloroflexota bacterium]
MGEKAVVLMTHELPEEWQGDTLNEYQVVLAEGGQKGITARLRDRLADASGIFCLLDDPIPAEILHNAPKLKVVSNLAAGVDNIDLDACTELGIPVGHTPGVLTDGTADLTLALLLSVARQLPKAAEDARRGRWTSWNPTGWLGADLKDSTAGIIGLGKIGYAVAQRLSGFGPRLIFTSKHPKPEQARILNAQQVSLDELLRTSDFICLHTALTAETRGMIDKSAFQIMKNSSILINAARGPVVNTDDLVKALETGQIRAAGLDVTDPEPLPPDHPLFRLENCLITPHIGSATHQTRRSMAEIALRNLVAGLTGSPLPHCANPEVYQST